MGTGLASQHESLTLSDIRQTMEIKSEAQIEFIPILCNLMDCTIALNDTRKVGTQNLKDKSKINLIGKSAGSDF